MTPAIETNGLTRRYGRRTALADCTLTIPAGRVVGLVGPNGAGKTTLLHLAVGLLAPSAGMILVLGERPGEGREGLARVGFVAQDTPLYGSFSVRDHLRLGGWCNPRWDDAIAERRLEQLGIDPHQAAGKLSGGQRAQLALTLAVAKRPELLVLDEPVASLDPLARRDFLVALSDVVEQHEMSVLLSSHLVGDLEQVCDELVLLVASHVRLAGPTEHLLASHRRLIGPRGRPPGLDPKRVVEARDVGGHSFLVVRGSEPVGNPDWSTEEIGLEDLTLAYMSVSTRAAAPADVTLVGGQ